MRFTVVILSALLCLPAIAENADERSDEALVAAAEQLISEGTADKTAKQQMATAVDGAAAGATSVATATSEATAESKPASSAELKESEIPVVISAKKEAKSESNLIWRLVASIAVIAVTAGAVLFASRKWRTHKDKGGQKARIEMLHQFHMGPRKSLALVRVSGEAILIGVTDQNINMLKTVTLIDDELENAMTKDFNNFLEDEFSIEDVRNALSPRA